MTALRRVTGAPGLIVALWIIELAVAASLGYDVKLAVASELGPYAILGDGHLLFAISDLMSDSSALASQLATATVGSAIIAAVLWTTLAGGVITRLAERTGWPAVTGATTRYLPAIAVTSLWHLLLRAVFVGLAMMAAKGLPEAARVPVLLAAVVISTCALDLARVHVVLHRGRGFHIKTAAFGYIDAFRNPTLLAKSVALSLLQWSCVLAIVLAATFGLGTTGAMLVVRPLALLALFFGLWRIAVIVDAGQVIRFSKASASRQPAVQAA